MSDARTICTCDRCGGTNLQLSAWIDAKTGKVLDDDGPLEQAYCLDCEDHVDWSATPERAEESALDERPDRGRDRDLRALLAGIRLGGVTALSKVGTTEVCAWQVRVYHARDVALRVGSVSAQASSPEEALGAAIATLLRAWNR